MMVSFTNSIGRSVSKSWPVTSTAPTIWSGGYLYLNPCTSCPSDSPCRVPIRQFNCWIRWRGQTPVKIDGSTVASLDTGLCYAGFRLHRSNFQRKTRILTRLRYSLYRLQAIAVEFCCVTGERYREILLYIVATDRESTS